MPRRRHRAKPKPSDAPRLPAKARPRTTPGSKRKAVGSAPAGRSGKAARARRTTAKPGAPAKTADRGGAHARRPAASTRKLPSASRKGAARKPRGRFTPPDPVRVAAILETLERSYPEAVTALDFESPLQLLIATILSAQCTDARVNMVTPGLFRRYPDATALAAAVPAELEEVIRSTGFYRNKARAIRECSADIVSRYGGEVPRTLDDLTTLRGVGRKTANVVLGNAFGIPGLVVDTHVARVSHRLGLQNEGDAVKIEFALMPLIPEAQWSIFSHWLILHGRRVCIARKPKCSICPLEALCPRIGVTASA